MIYTEHKPHVLLTPYIECYWQADADLPPFREVESLIPDGTIELMFNFGDDYHEVTDRGKERIKGSHIIGIRRKALRISQSSNQHIFSVRFRPGGVHAFFANPMHLFANGFWDMHHLLGNRYAELEERLYRADTTARIRMMDDFFLHKLRNSLAADTLAAACSAWMAGHPAASIADVCRLFNTHYKALERSFRTVIGLSPVELTKIRRFNRAIVEIYSMRAANLTQVGHACGYFDQSHFIREFKQLSGLTPRNFLKEQYTIVKVIQPALAERLSKSYNL